jgi:hypothetical protein
VGSVVMAPEIMARERICKHRRLRLTFGCFGTSMADRSNLRNKRIAHDWTARFGCRTEAMDFWRTSAGKSRTAASDIAKCATAAGVRNAFEICARALHRPGGRGRPGRDLRRPVHPIEIAIRALREPLSQGRGNLSERFEHFHTVVAEHVFEAIIADFFRVVGP